jgi:SpoVK/Ycf46/Vps4 family AAA+-type ATPase
LHSRPGRFDRLVYIGLPTEDDEKVRILEALTRKFRLESGGREVIDKTDRRKFLSDVVGLLSNKSLTSLTGADFYALCSDAMLAAISRTVRSIERAGGRVINEVIDNQVIDSEVIDNEVIDNKVINNEVIDNEVIDSEVIDNQVIDNQVIDNQVIDSRSNRIMVTLDDFSAAAGRLVPSVTQADLDYYQNFKQ